jgi:NADH-quinone oxidoreductase subunit E
MSCCCDRGKSGEAEFNSEAVDLTLMKEVLERNRHEAGSLITVLQETQGIYGYLPMTAIAAIARELKLKPARVYGAATFYTQFRFKPTGKHLILLCQGTACHVNGAARILAALGEELKIKIGETTSDGLFTLETAACLGCCSLAPVMMIDGQAYGPLTPEKATAVIKGIYSSESMAVGGGGKA